MPGMRRKGDLPSKPCAHCTRPFAWRRKWARDWDAVKYCSEACRGVARPGLALKATTAAPSAADSGRTR